MKTKLLKVIASTVLLIPQTGTAILANSNTAETDPAAQTETAAGQTGLQTGTQESEAGNLVEKNEAPVQSKEESDSEKKDGTASSQETNPAEPNPALVKADENQTAENKQQNDDPKSQKAAGFAVPADAVASGINGVKWYIDTAGALNFEAGELTSV